MTRAVEPLIFDVTGSGPFAPDGGQIPPALEEALQAFSGRSAVLFCDDNTRGLTAPVQKLLGNAGVKTRVYGLGGREPILDEKTRAQANEAAQGSALVAAVGAGTVTDAAKLAAEQAGAACLSYPTAASMDGYASSVAPLIRGTGKVTVPAAPPEWILLDYAVIASAPAALTAAGVGDLLAKFTCVLDWKLSALLNGEAFDISIAQAARQTAERILDAAATMAPDSPAFCRVLTGGLLQSGGVMRRCGSSRPASGAEHHISHYIEQDRIARGMPIPLHGAKVGLGTLVSAYFYHRIEEERLLPQAARAMRDELAALPTVEALEDCLRAVGAPVRFSGVGVDRAFLLETLTLARRVRGRYTVLSFLSERGLLEEWAADAADRFA